jgi:CheY-like chemotaxis protein
MPVMDGYEATQCIRQWEIQQNKKPCPIYALTAHIMQQQVNRCLEVGMNGHLIKPIEPMRLAEVFSTVAMPNGTAT